MSKIFISIVFTFFCSSLVFADVISYDTPEIKQLEAMGYDIDKTEKQPTLIFGSNGSNKILLTKNSERVVIFRNFTRKKLTQKDEFDLLQIVNNLNVETSYQVSLQNKSIIFALYFFGNYDPKVFAKLVRLIETCDSNWNNYPNLLKLLND